MKNKVFQFNLRWQLTAVITLIIIVTLGLVWVENSFFLENYYLSFKQSKLKELYTAFDGLDESKQLYKKNYYSEFEIICSENNIDCLIVEPNANIVLSTARDTTVISDHLFRVLFKTDEVELIESMDKYGIYFRKNKDANGDYLAFLGEFTGGNIIFMESPMASIRDFVVLTKRFLLLTGFIAIIIGTLLALFMARGILAPLGRLTLISQRMKEMEFEIKYSPKKVRDEIDLLGINMNEMSSMIEQNIKDLKQANLNLERDIKVKEKNELMRREFISNVSHELKTPISLIMGYAEGLTEDILDSKEKRNKYLGVISDEAHKMDSVITRLIELNEMEYGASQIQMARIDLSKITHEEIYSVLLLAGNADVNIENKIKGSLYVWSDEFLLRLVISNYLTNAIRYAQGEKKVTVSALDQENSVLFLVHNTGEWISDEHKERIWEKFYKVDPARTREMGGSGIGLSIVKAAADTLGTVCGFNNRDDGVEFYFSFDSRIPNYDNNDK